MKLSRSRLIIYGLLFAAAAGTLMVSVTASSVSSGTLDEKACVWYPEYATRDVYLQDTPEKYSTDVVRAFKEDPDLRGEVCLAVDRIRSEAPLSAVDEREGRLRTILANLCIGGSFNELRARTEARTAEVSTTLEKWLTESDAYAASIPENERYDTFETLREAFDSQTGAERFKTALRMIVLRPEDDRGVYLARIASNESLDDRGFFGTSRVREFLKRTYESRAASHGEDAVPWRAGLRGIYLYEGEFEKARRAAQQTADERRTSDPLYDQIFAAVVGVALGDEKSLQSLVASCPEKDCAHYDSLVQSIAYRTTITSEKKTPQAVRTLLAAAVRNDRVTWPQRVDSLVALARIDDPRTDIEARRLLAMPHDQIPPEVLGDAVRRLREIAVKEGDLKQAMRLDDCWLKVSAAELSTLTPDGWSQVLAIVPDIPSQEEPFSEGCFDLRGSPEAEWKEWDCTVAGLGRRLDVAIAQKRWDTARQTIEVLAAHSIKHQLHLGLRTALAQIADELADDGRKSEAIQIAGFLARMPFTKVKEMRWRSETTEKLLYEKLGSPTLPSPNEPWTSPTHTDNPVGSGCD